MSQININIEKSWNELRWIDDQQSYRSLLANSAKEKIKEAHNFSDYVATRDWSRVNIALQVVLIKLGQLEIVEKSSFLKIRATEDSVSTTQEFFHVLQNHLLICIELTQNNLLKKGKKTKIDIAKIAEVALQNKFKHRKEDVFLFREIAYPYFSLFDLDATLKQIKKDKNNAIQIATNNLLSLIGLSLDLLEQFHLNQSARPPAIEKKPEIPKKTYTSELIPPHIFVLGEGGSSFNSVQVGRQTKISFHRTLRVPEDGREYPLPAGLGAFPIQRVEDFADTVPPHWLEEGGFFIPLYQREALFIQFEGSEWSPSIAKVCVGRINAITGKPYSENLSGHTQDYVVIPKQKLLDGINSGSGTVKQFVAMPLGQGYTVEAQITDEEKHGAFQLVVYEPVDGRFIKTESFIDEKVKFLTRISTSNFELMLNSLNSTKKHVINLIRNGSTAAVAEGFYTKQEVIKIYNNFRTAFFGKVSADTKRHFGTDENYQIIASRTLRALWSLGLREDIDPVEKLAPVISDSKKSEGRITLGSSPSAHGSGETCLFSPAPAFQGPRSVEMGIAAGGMIKQQIFQDTYGVQSWDFNRRRLFKIYMVNSELYKLITGSAPPSSPISIEQYEKSGIPWFSQYDETAQSLKGARIFKNILGVGAIDKSRGIKEESHILRNKISPDTIRRIKTPTLDEAIQSFRSRAQDDVHSGRWLDAIRQINFLIDLDSGVIAQDYAVRSLCNCQMKRYWEGMFDGEKALEIDPDCSDALSSRAFCRIHLGDFTSVKQDIEQLMRMPETELIGLELRAEASLLSGRYSDAIYDALALGKKEPGHRRAAEILDQARKKAQQKFENNRSI